MDAGLCANEAARCPAILDEWRQFVGNLPTSSADFGRLNPLETDFKLPRVVCISPSKTTDADRPNQLLAKMGRHLRHKHHLLRTGTFVDPVTHTAQEKQQRDEAVVESQRRFANLSVLADQQVKVLTNASQEPLEVGELVVIAYAVAQQGENDHAGNGDGAATAPRREDEGLCYYVAEVVVPVWPDNTELVQIRWFESVDSQSWCQTRWTNYWQVRFRRDARTELVSGHAVVLRHVTLTADGSFSRSRRAGGTGVAVSSHSEMVDLVKAKILGAMHSIVIMKLWAMLLLFSFPIFALVSNTASA